MTCQNSIAYTNGRSLRPPYPPEGRLWYPRRVSGHRLGEGEIDGLRDGEVPEGWGDGVWCVEYEGSDPKGGYEFSLRWLLNQLNLMTEDLSGKSPG